MKPDLLPIALRCFTKQSEEDAERLREKVAKREAIVASRRCSNQCRKKQEKEDSEPSTHKLTTNTHDPELEEYIREIGGPWPYGVTVFDFETTTGCMTGQKIRFGYFQRRGLQYDSRDPAKATILKHAKARALTREMLDQVTTHGFIVNPEVLSEDEFKTLKKFVDNYNSSRHLREIPQLLKLITVEAFVTGHLLKKRFVNWHKRIRDPHMIIGHNIIFDFGAMTTHAVKSRGKTYGGLSMTLCSCCQEDENGNLVPEGDPASARRGKIVQCPKHGTVVGKKIGPKKYFYKRSERFPQPLTVSPDEQAWSVVDTLTLAKALGGAGTPASLEELTWKFNTKHKKAPEEHGEKLTPEYVRYCMNDVASTFEVFQALRGQYKSYDLDKPLDRLYSSASVGKALLEKLGVVPFSKAHPDFDHQVSGIFYEGYSGGRSNLDCRHEARECIYADGRSQYPSANGLLDNQSLLLAGQIEIARDDPETKTFLESLDIHKLLLKGTWPRLKGMAFIEPDGDILQIRAAFDSAHPETSNVGTVKVRTGPPIWVSFPDLAYSILMTGKCPKILSTMELVPVGRRKTGIIDIMGDPDYRIDLSEGSGQDLFIRLIDLRTKIKKQMKAGVGAQEKAQLKGIDTFLKEVANSCGYGILIEMILDESSEPQEIDIFYGDQKQTRRPRSTYTDDNGDRVRNDFTAELPGKYNAPFGTLITAGARLLLGLSEYLAKESGIDCGAMDTDSLCFLRPDWMERGEFYDAVHDILQKLQTLNPYADDDFFLKVETQNFGLKDDVSGEADEPPPNIFDRSRMVPLYFLGVSPKRYALANFADAATGVPVDPAPGAVGQWIIRKASAHGAANVVQPSCYDPGLYPETVGEHIAAPLKEDHRNPDVFRRNYGSLINGRAPRLMLDLWRLAFDLFADTNNVRPLLQERFRRDIDVGMSLRPHALLSRFMEAHEQLQTPQSTELSITTAHMWKLHAEGENPIPNIRPGMFLQTLPMPVYYCQWQRAAAKTDHRQKFNRTLIADGGLKLSAKIEDYPVDENGNRYGLYWRDTHEFPCDLFTNQEPLADFLVKGVSNTNQKYFPHLKTIADGLKDYFNHPNSKAADPYHTGHAAMREIIVAGMIRIGKCSNPMLCPNEGDDDETLEEEFGAQAIVNFVLNPRILNNVNLDALSGLSGIPKTRLEHIVTLRAPEAEAASRSRETKSWRVRGRRQTAKAGTREGRMIFSYLMADKDGNIVLKKNKPKTQIAKFCDLEAIRHVGKGKP